MLAAIRVERQPLDVAVVAQRNRVRFFGDQVFDIQLADFLVDDLSAALIGIFVAQLDQILANEGEDVLLAAQELFVALDLFAELIVVLDDLVALEGSELAELHAHDGFGLRLGHVIDRMRADLLLQGGEMLIAQGALQDRGGHVQLLQAFLRRRSAGRVAADLDDLVDRRNRDELAFEHMAALLRLIEQELRPPADDVHPMPQEFFEGFLQRQRFRPVVDKRQQDDAHGLLQRRKLIELVEHEVRIGVALEIDDDAHRLPGAGARFVADFADTLNALILHEFADGLAETPARQLIRHFLDDDSGFVALFANVSPSPQNKTASPRAIAFDNARAPADDAAGRKIRPRNVLHELIDGGVRVVDETNEAVANLAEVVRGDFRRHADRNAVRAVHQQVGELTWQYERLAVLVVIAVDEIHRTPIQILDHFCGDGGQASLRVPHLRGRLSFNGAEVALTMNQPVPHGPILGHAHEGGVDGAVAVRVIALHRLADDTGALARCRSRAEAQLVH